MRAAVLGGGPGGLNFAISLKLRDPSHDVVVIERNKPDDTFGWGVVLSDETLEQSARQRSRQRQGNPRLFRLLGRHRRALPRRGGAGSGGHGFCGIGRKRLLNILQDRARALGVSIAIRDRGRAGRQPTPRNTISSSAPMASTRRSRAAHADVFKPDIDVRACKYIWLGTHQKFDDAFTFIFEETEHGWIWVHAYQFDADTATFIVECSEETWRRAGFDRMNARRDHRGLREASSPNISAAKR